MLQEWGLSLQWTSVCQCLNQVLGVGDVGELLSDNTAEQSLRQLERGRSGSVFLLAQTIFWAVLWYNPQQQREWGADVVAPLLISDPPWSHMQASLTIYIYTANKISDANYHTGTALTEQNPSSRIQWIISFQSHFSLLWKSELRVMSYSGYKTRKTWTSVTSWWLQAEYSQCFKLNKRICSLIER